MPLWFLGNSVKFVHNLQVTDTHYYFEFSFKHLGVLFEDEANMKGIDGDFWVGNDDPDTLL